MGGEGQLVRRQRRARPHARHSITHSCTHASAHTHTSLALPTPTHPPHHPQTRYNPIKTIKTSFIGTMNMLGLAKRCRARFLISSTSEVYGDPLQHPQVGRERWGSSGGGAGRFCLEARLWAGSGRAVQRAGRRRQPGGCSRGHAPAPATLNRHPSASPIRTSHLTRVRPRSTGATSTPLASAAATTRASARPSASPWTTTASTARRWAARAAGCLPARVAGCASERARRSRHQPRRARPRARLGSSAASAPHPRLPTTTPPPPPHRRQVRIVRIFNTYGPRMALDDGRVVSNFVSQVG